MPVSVHNDCFQACHPRTPLYSCVYLMPAVPPSLPPCLQDFLRSGCDLEVSLKDLRLLLPTLSADAAAIAGQAVALSQWHQTHTFCNRCGLATLPTEGGARRRCTNRPQHKLYPRTDPVVSEQQQQQQAGKVGRVWGWAMPWVGRTPQLFQQCR
jgi:hypothetical protein